MKVCKVFLDTNILIYHTFEDFDVDKHRSVTSILQQLHKDHYSLYISSQIIREFVAVATNEKIFHTPLQGQDVILKVNEFQNNFYVLFDTENSLTILKDLIARYHITKYHVHDTNIAATVVANRLDYLWTFNEKDFAKFDEVQLLQCRDMQMPPELQE